MSRTASLTSAPAPVATAPRNPLGIALMASGFFTYSVVDTGAKLLTEELNPVEIVWVRSLGFLVAVLVMIAREGVGVLRTPRPGLQVLRGALMVTSATLFIAAIAYVPLADAVAISFVAPFFVTILAALWLHEPVGIRRWAAVAIGFAGAVVILRPGMGVIHPAGALVLLAALAFALRQALSRILSAIDDTRTTVAYSAIVSSLLATVPLPFFWHWPHEPRIYAVMAGVAVLAALAEFLVIRALEVAEAVAVAPVHYSLIIYSTFWGWLVFHQLPDRWTLIGAAVIVVSGAYSIYRERLSLERRRRGNRP